MTAAISIFLLALKPPEPSLLIPANGTPSLAAAAVNAESRVVSRDTTLDGYLLVGLAGCDSTILFLSFAGVVNSVAGAEAVADPADTPADTMDDGKMDDGKMDTVSRADVEAAASRLAPASLLTCFPVTPLSAASSSIAILNAPGEPGCRADDSASAAIVIRFEVAPRGAIASTAAAGVVSGNAPANAPGDSADHASADGAGSDSEVSGPMGANVNLGACLRSGWLRLVADTGVEFAGAAATAVLAALVAAASEVFRKSPRATRSVPLACSTLMGLVTTRLAPMRYALAMPACPATRAIAREL
jgi:hypothetical protein